MGAPRPQAWYHAVPVRCASPHRKRRPAKLTMYRLDWIEKLKLRTTDTPARALLRQVDPVVWRLGIVSFLTDVSSEMVNSALPAYLMLYLHLTPVQFGAIDGVYNGLAVAVLSLFAGLVADRTRRPKYVAVLGYALSAVCKLFLAAAGAWVSILAVVWVDRVGKGIRTAPRDTMISLATPPPVLATAFSVHRTLDAGGSLLGPVVAFGLLTVMVDRYDLLWTVSFGFALVGVVFLLMLVKPKRQPAPVTRPESVSTAAPGSGWRGLARGRFPILALCGFLLAATTVSDGFIYLQLQKSSHLAVGLFPLFYFVTACFYVAFSIPSGILADRIGRLPVLLCGYAALIGVYALVGSEAASSPGGLGLCLLLFGFFYAATEGVLTAMASALIAPELRASGLASLATAVALGKAVSSILFGWLWESQGTGWSMTLFAGLLVPVVAFIGWSLGGRHTIPGAPHG